MSLFYSEAILNRRGPLARVWLAAHYERRLSKTQTLQTDISESVDSIVGDEHEVIPMALRLSGQLLLGVVRIYSRKAKYLLDDCNEAITKIKMAFRPGAVDLTEEQLAVNRNAITISGDGFDADFMMADINWDDFDMPIPQGNHIAHDAAITLAQPDLGFDFSDDFAYADLGSAGVIGSQDFAIGLTFDGAEEPIPGEQPHPGDETMSVEQGRDMGVYDDRLSIRSGLGGDQDLSVIHKDRSSVFGDIFDGGAPGGFEAGFDAGFGDLGLNLEDEPPVPPLEGEKTPTQARSRASTPLSPPPQTPPQEGSLPLPSPRTAAQLEQMAEQLAHKKTRGPKKQIIDKVTELKDGPGPRGRRGLGDVKDQDVSAITTKHSYLPRSRTVTRLLQIRADPLAYFMPTKQTEKGPLIFAGPPGLAPELASLFTFPVPDLRRARSASADLDTREPKRPRLTESEAPEAELARRARESEAGLIDFGPEGDITTGLDTTIDFGDVSMQIDMPPFEPGMGTGMDIDIEMPEMPLPSSRPPISRRKSKAPASHISLVDDTRATPGPFDVGGIAGDYEAQSCSIGIFDMRSGTESQPMQEIEEIERETADVDVQSKGYSKNTVKAIGVIKRSLKEAEADEDGEKVMSFAKVSEKASRRAASAFFFELLVLGTRDAVKLAQGESFEDIHIRPKQKLWETLGGDARQESLKPTSVAA